MYAPFRALKRWLKKRFDAYFAQKIKAHDTHQLTQNRIYIFANRYGALFTLLLLCVFIAGVNYANNMVMGVCFILASMLVVSLHVTYAQLSGLTIRLEHVQPCFLGNSYEVIISITAQGKRKRQGVQLYFDYSHQSIAQTWIALQQQHHDEMEHIEPMLRTRYQQIQQQVLGDAAAYLRVFHVYHSDAAALNTLSNTPSTIQLRFVLPAIHMGAVPLPRLVVKCVYPFGLVRAWAYVYFKQPARIAPMPRFMPLEDIPNAAPHMQSGATARVNTIQPAQQQAGDELAALQPYQAGDALRRVDWKRYARVQTLYSKRMEFAPVTQTQMHLVLKDMPAPTILEKRRILLGAAIVCEEQQIAFSAEIDAVHLPRQQGIAHLQQLIDVLIATS